MATDLIIDENIISDIRYIISLLELPIRYVSSDDILSEHKVDVLLIMNEQTEPEDVNFSGYEHIIMPVTLKPKLNHSKIHYMCSNGVAYAMLFILFTLFDNYSAKSNDLIVAILSLIEIMENQKNDFIEKSRLKDLEGEINTQFINHSELFIAGKANDFRAGLVIQESGRTEITFDLRRFHFLQINKLRLDPHTEGCAVFNCEFYLEYPDGEKVQLTDYTTNAAFFIEGKYYFLHGDSNIIFKPLDKINPLYLHCSFEISSLENTKYFSKLSTVKEVKKFYQSLFDDGNLKGICNPKNCLSDTANENVELKQVYFLLGPKSIGLERISNFLLDHTGMLIDRKIFYPTHQREFFDKIGCESLYSLFSRKMGNIVVFDEHKSRFLQKDLLTSKFDNLLLISEGFLGGERLLDCIKTFDEAKFIYYVFNGLEMIFEKYKSEIFFNRSLKRFEHYVLTESTQIKDLFALLKYVPSEKLILRNFSSYHYDIPNKIIDEFLEFDLLIPRNYKDPFNLSEISNTALEFRRLMNFFTIIDNTIEHFLQHALLEYKGEFKNYIWLTQCEYEAQSEILRQKLEIIFGIFNRHDDLKTLWATNNELNISKLEQVITSDQIEDIMLFLKEKDTEMYLRLVIELKLSKNVITDNAAFNEFIEQI